MKRPPMLAILARHRFIVFLQLLQVALTFAILSNVVLMIVQRIDLMKRPSGLVENELVMIESIDLTGTDNFLAREEADLAFLRKVAGVKSAAAVDALPFNGASWDNGISTSLNTAARVSATAFSGTPHELSVLGLHLLEGRDFRPDEYVPMDSAHDWAGINHVPVAIVSKALAEKLFPGQSVLGRLIYPGNSPVRIVGVVDHLLRPQPGGDESSEYSVLFPMLPDTSAITYVMRVAPGDRREVLNQAAAKLHVLNINRILRHVRTFTRLRVDYFQRDRTMIGLLLAAAAGLFSVTVAGIAGLASFWVQQRRQSIGICRAVGASRRQIRHDFQIENFLIVSAGVVLGCVLACLLNQVLMARYELMRLPAWYLPADALTLWLTGQLAVLGPARRAAAVPPVMAMRMR